MLAPFFFLIIELIKFTHWPLWFLDPDLPIVSFFQVLGIALFAAILSAIAGAFIGAIISIVVTCIYTRPRYITLVETPRWSLMKTVSLLMNISRNQERPLFDGMLKAIFVIGTFVIHPIVPCVYAAAWILTNRISTRIRPSLQKAVLLSLSVVLIWVFMVALSNHLTQTLIGISMIFVVGLFSSQTSSELGSTAPNQGIRRSMRSAFLAGLTIGAGMALLEGLLVGLSFGLFSGLLGELLGGLIGGLIGILATVATHASHIYLYVWSSGELARSPGTVRGSSTMAPS